MEKMEKMNKKYDGDFDDFRFKGLNHKKTSEKYLVMDRVSENEDRLVVKVADNHLIKTKFGYGLILDRTHVVFLKEWQANKNHYGNEVLLIKDYFNVKEWGEFDAFAENGEALTFEYWLKAAKEQDSITDEEGIRLNGVRWREWTKPQL